jgi:hypothetical protein
MKAARIVRREFPRWLRLWYWLTLPRVSRTRSRWQKSRAGSRAEFFGILLLVGLAVGLALFKPDLPQWVPPSYAAGDVPDRTAALRWYSAVMLPVIFAALLASEPSGEMVCRYVPDRVFQLACER